MDDALPLPRSSHPPIDLQRYFPDADDTPLYESELPSPVDHEPRLALVPTPSPEPTYQVPSNFLESLFLGPHPRNKREIDKRPVLKKDDPSECAICMLPFATSTSRPIKHFGRKNKKDAEKTSCLPMRIHPCNHIIGATCYFTWFNAPANEDKELTCLLCTRAVGVPVESHRKQKLRRLLGSEAAYIGETATIIVVLSPALIVGGLGYGVWIGGKWIVEKGVKVKRERGMKKAATEGVGNWEVDHAALVRSHMNAVASGPATPSNGGW